MDGCTSFRSLVADSVGVCRAMSNGTELRQEFMKQGSANTQSSIEKSIVSKLFGFVKYYALRIS